MIVRIGEMALALLLLLAATAAAHDGGTSYSSWTIEGSSAQVSLRVSELDLSRFGWADTEIVAQLVQRLRLFVADAPCVVAGKPRRLAAEEGTISLEWSLRCPAAAALEIRDDLLYDVAPTHLHFARVTRDGSAALERVLSERDRRWPLGGGSVGSSLGEYVLLGIEHILSGYDHLAFLIALLLAAASVGEVAGVVTGFTAAHSITLAAAVLGAVRPAPAAIEALIGLSIALVAAENLWLSDRRGRALPLGIALVLAVLALGAALGVGRVPALTLAGLAVFSFCYFALIARAHSPQRLRWCVAFLFGLLHGFGFATALCAARLPAERLVQALFGFNGGVELGQLAVVAMLWPLLRVARRPPIADLCSAAVVALGVFWFVTRAYG